MPSPWSPRPAALTAEPGWVHVFRLALDLPADQLNALVALLDEDEYRRASRYMRQVDRQRFVAAHGQMRAILAGYLGGDPAGLRFDHNEQGKPFLEEQAGDND